jgi:hypothetical protein
LNELPWHLIDTWWDLGEDRFFISYSVDVTVSADVPSSVRLYIAPIGLGFLNKTQFYGGLQTDVYSRTRADETRRWIGPGFIFSMWGERSFDAIRASEGALCDSAVEDPGDFVGVRRAFQWKKGSYTFHLVRMDREEVEGKPYTWVGAFVRVHTTGENIFLGALRFGGEDLVLDRRVANFVEIYGPDTVRLDQIPKVQITFGNLRVNRKPVEKLSAIAIYPDGVPDYARAVAKEHTIVITLGELVKDRPSRKVELFKP